VEGLLAGLKMEFSKAWHHRITNRTSYKINISSILIKLIMNDEFIQSEARRRDHQDELSGFQWLKRRVPNLAPAATLKIVTEYLGI